MKKLLIVVDMQNDFIYGSLGSKAAANIIGNVVKKIELYKEKKDFILFTQDTHDEDYLKTQEGKYLPIIHCIENSMGHNIISELNTYDCTIFKKNSFGTLELGKYILDNFKEIDEIELCGVCTDICVVSNALILKAQIPEIKLSVDANCCAGVTIETHQAALLTMKSCQINIINEDNYV